MLIALAIAASVILGVLGMSAFDDLVAEAEAEAEAFAEQFRNGAQDEDAPTQDVAALIEAVETEAPPVFRAAGGPLDLPEVPQEAIDAALDQALSFASSEDPNPVEEVPEIATEARLMAQAPQDAVPLEDVHLLEKAMLGQIRFT